VIAQPMSFVDGEAVRELRLKLRRMIEEDLPAGFHGAFVSGHAGQDVADEFCRRLAEENLLTMSLPHEFGGTDASIWEQTALREEMWAHHEPRGAQYMGLNWVGPAIMRFGTPEQVDGHLTAITSGDAVWCQGFSEPDAGSDLASLRLRAEHTGDGEWRLSGQKIWTSYASLAQWCFLTARTDTSGSKHHGITVFLVPMDRPGVTVREIDSMLGPHHLNEVFFEDVVATEAEILGELDHGWDVIRYVLAHERIGIARYARSERILSLLAGYLPAADRPEADALRAAHSRLLVKARTARLMNYRAIASTTTSEVPGGVSGARLTTTLLDQEVAELALEILGEEGLYDDDLAPLEAWVESAWRYARSATIASGTSEVQRLLIARSMIAEGSR
jgi:alkylation response protein AidB-like acyl-CoA dehydrogenase